uniref:Dual specificity phosphatase 26 n=1 Tax=Myotis myotis TaxID=51298 RepID=A0A7J7Z284_MYOMY|nr:dual specificity phosphatase 26 [Myotis myotis]
MCPGNWLWASMTFMARFSRSSSRSPVRTRGALEEMPAVQHPFLNVFELERLLYTGKTACNHADEVWPGLYLGDQEDPGALCRGSEPIRHAGAGLPHAVPPPHPRGGHQESQGPPRHHPQPGLLETAPGPGPQAAAGSGGLRGGEGSSGQARGSLAPSWREEAQ